MCIVLCLSICNKLEDVLTNFIKKSKYEIKKIKRIHVVGGMLFHTERWTDR